MIFKLYPWEYIVNEEFGQAVFKDMEHIGEHDEDGNYIGGTIWIEAPYKMLWSNKGILAVLWQLFGNDPEKSQYLIPSWFEGEQPVGLTDYVRKPLLSREGANVTIFEDGQPLEEHGGIYGDEGYIVQELASPPAFSDESGQAFYPVLGVWMIDGEPSGMGVRESTTLVTDNRSFFACHYIQPTTESEK